MLAVHPVEFNFLLKQKLNQQQQIGPSRGALAQQHLPAREVRGPSYISIMKLSSALMVASAAIAASYELAIITQPHGYTEPQTKTIAFDDDSDLWQVAVDAIRSSPGGILVHGCNTELCLTRLLVKEMAAIVKGAADPNFDAAHHERHYDPYFDQVQNAPRGAVPAEGIKNRFEVRKIAPVWTHTRDHWRARACRKDALLNGNPPPAFLAILLERAKAAAGR